MEILQRASGDRCFYCQRDDFEQLPHIRTLDHLVPLCRGGGNDIWNLVICCTKCNNAKADMTWWEYVQTDAYRQRRDWIAYMRAHPPKPKFRAEVITSLVVA